MKWEVGCDLNVAEDPTIITLVRVKVGKVKMLSLSTT